MARRSTRWAAALGVLTVVALGLAGPAGATTITPPGNVTVQARPGQNGATVTFGPPTVNGAPQGTTVACTYSSGSFFPIGTTRVFCQAREPSGTQVTASFSVTVTGQADNQAPTLSSPGIISVTARPGANGAAVGYAGVSASDNSGNVSAITCSPPPGSAFPIGATTVTCAARDAAGNVGRVSFQVVVRSGGPAPTSGTTPTTGGGGGTVTPGPTGTTTPGLCYPCKVTTTTAPTTAPPTTQNQTTTPLTVSPILAGRDTTTISLPRAVDHTPPKEGGNSTKVAAYGSLGVLAAGMVLALLARWRFDREPI